MNGSNKKKALTKRSVRKSLFSGFLVFGGILGLVAFALLTFFIKSAADMISIAQKNSDALALIFAALMFLTLRALSLVSLVPAVKSAYNIFTLFYRFSLTEDEIEYIRPHEKEKRERVGRYETKIVHIHGLYFKSGKRCLTDKNCDDYRTGGRYIIASSGKKVLAMYDTEKFYISE